MNSAVLNDDLMALLRRLRLPYIREHAPEVLATAKSQRWDPSEVLKVLLKEEVQGRDRSMKELRRKAANFPSGKTFDSWREDQSSIPIQTQRALQTLEWITRREALSISGPSGTGKSHFVEALGHLCIEEGMKVSWFTLETLTQVINGSKADATTAKVVERICRADLIVVDDIGMLLAGQAEAEALYRLIEAAYEKRSVAITSNIHPSGFDTIMPRALAAPMVDRLLHHAHVILTEGDSRRLLEAMDGRGVVPIG